MLIANWPLDSFAGPSTQRLAGYYTECDNGTRAFVLSDHGSLVDIQFDASGQLTNWFEHGSGCDQLACSSPNQVDPSCSGDCPMTCTPDCQMTADPPPAGTVFLPTGVSNGPAPVCMVDANGRWLAPGPAPN